MEGVRSLQERPTQVHEEEEIVDLGSFIVNLFVLTTSHEMTCFSANILRTDLQRTFLNARNNFRFSLTAVVYILPDFSVCSVHRNALTMICFVSSVQRGTAGSRKHVQFLFWWLCYSLISDLCPVVEQMWQTRVEGLPPFAIIKYMWLNGLQV